jgi:CheY-like chemotaxis protein
VWLAPAGAEGVALFRDHRQEIDAVLLDVNMPGMSGPETLQALRAVNPNVRGCFMTGDSSARGEEELAGLTDAPVLIKPFTCLDAVVLRVNELTNRAG